MVERIRELCANASMSLNGLEKTLGLGLNTIYKWDKASPSAEKLKLVADYFNVTVDYLLGSGNDSNSPNSASRENEVRSIMDDLEMLHKNPKLRVLLSSTAKLDKTGVDAVIEIVKRMNTEEENEW